VLVWSWVNSLAVTPAVTVTNDDLAHMAWRATNAAQVNDEYVRHKRWITYGKLQATRIDRRHTMHVNSLSTEGRKRRDRCKPSSELPTFCNSRNEILHSFACE
jgi:hypothetical protein